MKHATLAIIGGSGLTQLPELEITHREVVRTPYGEPSGPLIEGALHNNPVVFLARHGNGHTIPPHLVNYRANLWALKQSGIRKVISVAAVGAIRGDLESGGIVFPNQIIDYTYSRAHTFYDGEEKRVTHVDFTHPYCEDLRTIFIQSAEQAKIKVPGDVTYAATQGPRFETVAEINRLERDGADIVGMTGMPETGLAKELGLCYATIAVVVNPAAGKGEGAISMSDIDSAIESGMKKVKQLLKYAIPAAVNIAEGDI